MSQWCHSTEYKMSQNTTFSSKNIFKGGQVARYASVWQKSWLRSESSNRSSNTWRWLFIIITIVDILVHCDEDNVDCTEDNVLWMIVIQEVVCQKSGSLIYSSLLGITIILAAEDDDDDNDDGDDDDHGDDDDDDDDDHGVFLFKLEILTLDNRRVPSSYPV